MRVLVCGGGDYADRGAVFLALDRLHRKRGISVLIVVDEPGAADLAYSWALSRKVEAWRFMPGSEHIFTSGRPDGVVAFPGADSGIVRQALAAGVNVWEPVKAAVSEAA